MQVFVEVTLYDAILYGKGDFGIMPVEVHIPTLSTERRRALAAAASVKDDRVILRRPQGRHGANIGFEYAPARVRSASLRDVFTVLDEVAAMQREADEVRQVAKEARIQTSIHGNLHHAD